MKSWIKIVWAVPFLCVGALLAADVKIEQNPVATGSFATVHVTVDKDETILTEIEPEPIKVTEYKTDKGVDVVFAGVKGTPYRVRVDGYKIVDGKVIVSRKKETVTFTGPDCPEPKPNPDPGPKPDPKPDPDPGPGGKVSKFVVVEQTSKAGTWRGHLLGSPKVAALYKSLALSHRIVDVDGEASDKVAVDFKDKAKGKDLPWLFVLNEKGEVIRDLALPLTDDKFVEALNRDTSVRALGAVMAKPKLKWTKFGSTPQTPLIPRTEWKEVDYSAFLPAVYDQDGVGQCASSAACTAAETVANQVGFPFPKLSAGDLYSRVNGGRDQGSMPEDNLNELLVGVAPASKVPYIWNGRRYTDAATQAERKKYRISQAYLCDSFEAMVSALQQGFVIEEAIWWYDNDTPNSKGWLPDQGRGGRGGHALCGFGVTKREDGTWGVKTRNSWSSAWGIGGNCVIPESRFSFEFGSVFAVRSVVQTAGVLGESRKKDVDVFADRFTLAP